MGLRVYALDFVGFIDCGEERIPASLQGFGNGPAQWLDFETVGSRPAIGQPHALIPRMARPLIHVLKEMPMQRLP